MGKWPQRIGGTLIDQGLFAGSNFVLNVLLARWMPAEEYGAFVVAYAWFLIPVSVYEAIMNEPMSIYGAGKYAKHFKRYLGFLYYGHVGVGLVVFLILGLGALFAYFFHSSEPQFLYQWTQESFNAGLPPFEPTHVVSSAMLGIAMAAPFILMRWLTRQPFYISATPHLSALGGLVYFTVALTTTVGLYLINLLTPLSAALAMGFGGLVSSVFLTVFLLHPVYKDDESGINWRKIVNDHWQYGRWATGTRLLMWIPVNLPYIVFPIFFGLSTSAGLRALLNLIMPVTMTINAMTAILLPSFVRLYHGQGREKVLVRVRVVIMINLVLTGVYCLAVTLLGKPIMHLVFDGKFDDMVTIPILFTMGLTPILIGVNVILDAALRAMGGVRQSFMTRLTPAVLALTVGIVLLARFELLGRNLAALLYGLVTMVLLLRYHKLGVGEVSKDTEARSDDLSGETPAADLSLDEL
jgi:O-antigen/teichoic acid export membrane protein